MPRLLNIHGRPQTVDGKILKPMENYGLKVMSMGFLVDEETPMIWRGPMVMSALTQMLREVEWGAARRAGRRHAARHRRRPADHGAAGAAGRRRHRLDAAGPGPDRRPQGPQHVQEGRCAAARHRREHELFHRARHRQALRHFRPWRRAQARPSGSASPSSAKCRCRWKSARPPIAARRSSSRSRTAPKRRSIATSPQRSGSGLSEERGSAGSRAGDRVRVGTGASDAGAYVPLTFSLNVEKNSPGELLRGRGDQPAAELGDLAADIGLGRVFEDRHVRRRPRSG